MAKMSKAKRRAAAKKGWRTRRKGKRSKRNKRCKYGALKTPYRDAHGRMHYCRKKRK